MWMKTAAVHPVYDVAYIHTPYYEVELICYSVTGVELKKGRELLSQVIHLDSGKNVSSRVHLVIDLLPRGIVMSQLQDVL